VPDHAKAASDEASDNVILMPLPSGHSEVESEPSAQLKPPASTVAAPSYTDILAHAISEPDGEYIAAGQKDGEPHQDGSTLAGLVEPVRSVSVSETTDETAGNHTVATSMNVRIVQRTADVQIPMQAMSNGQTIDFVRTGINMGPLVQTTALETVDQLALDFQIPETGSVDEPDALELDAFEGPGSQADQPVVLLEAVAADDPGDAGLIENNKSLDDLSEVELEEISRRFAPKH